MTLNEFVARYVKVRKAQKDFFRDPKNTMKLELSKRMERELDAEAEAILNPSLFGEREEED
jgi:hypothetical protein